MHITLYDSEMKFLGAIGTKPPERGYEQNTPFLIRMAETENKDDHFLSFSVQGWHPALVSENKVRIGDSPKIFTMQDVTMQKTGDTLLTTYDVVAYAVVEELIGWPVTKIVLQNDTLTSAISKVLSGTPFTGFLHGDAPATTITKQLRPDAEEAKGLEKTVSNVHEALDALAELYDVEFRGIGYEIHFYDEFLGNYQIAAAFGSGLREIRLETLSNTGYTHCISLMRDDKGNQTVGDKIAANPRPPLLKKDRVYVNVVQYEKTFTVASLNTQSSTWLKENSVVQSQKSASLSEELFTSQLAHTNFGYGDLITIEDQVFATQRAKIVEVVRDYIERQNTTYSIEIITADFKKDTEKSISIVKNVANFAITAASGSGGGTPFIMPASL